jgi:hypothetical protein
VSGGGQIGSERNSSKQVVSSGSNEPKAAAGNIEGSEPLLMAENSGDKDGVRLAMSRRPLVLEKSSYQATNNFPKRAISLTSIFTMLVDTPEPGSLFLLGTGLLGLALALFWKSAKGTTRS